MDKIYSCPWNHIAWGCVSHNITSHLDVWGTNKNITISNLSVLVYFIYFSGISPWYVASLFPSQLMWDIQSTMNKTLERVFQQCPSTFRSVFCLMVVHCLNTQAQTPLHPEKVCQYSYHVSPEILIQYFTFNMLEIEYYQENNNHHCHLFVSYWWPEFIRHQPCINNFICNVFTM